jgi:hypothetical protein
MLKNCAQVVFRGCVTILAISQLYTALANEPGGAEYKSGTNPLLCSQFSHQLTPSFLVQITTVTRRLMHTIHTPNKNYKKFFILNLLFIYPEVVYI